MPVPDRHHEHDDQPTATAADPNEQEPGWPVPGRQWASLVVALLGGQAVALVLTTWTLATATSHGWPLPILLALGLLGRLVPDTLSMKRGWSSSGGTGPFRVRTGLWVRVAVATAGDGW